LEMQRHSPNKWLTVPKKSENFLWNSSKLTLLRRH
jgi:hypothetical protein